MKITAVRSFVVYCYRTNWVFVKVETDDGIYGVGEATLEYKENAIVGAIEDLSHAVAGKDPRRIERLYHDLYRDAYWRGGPVLMSALSAVEMACWDILGKSLGVPVYQLLGGAYRESIPIYVNGWFSGARTPKEFAARARQTAQRGVTAMKWDPFGKAYMTISRSELELALACIAAVRDAVGDSVDLLIEGHGRFNTATAIEIAIEIAPFRPVWFEEPVPPDDLDALAEVCRRTEVPIAAGERLFTRHAFLELFNKGAADYVQPDVSHAGGIAECRKIAAMAEARYIPCACHNPSGPVATAATLQLAACTPNFTILEIMSTDVPWRGDITDERLVYENGEIRIPDRPGLGIELREEELAKHPYEPRNLRHYTGELTDIRPPEQQPFF